MSNVVKRRLQTMVNEIGVSGAAVAAKLFVKFDGAGKYVQNAGTATVSSAVSVTATTAADQQITVQKKGTATVIAAAALTVGGPVMSSAAGKAVDATGGNRICGIARTAGGVDPTDATIELSLPSTGKA